MSIAYTYEIVNVDPQARCMEIIYRSEGRQTMHIGARLPYKNETLEAIVHMYAPVAYWLEQEAQVVVPEIGASGAIEPQEPSPPTQEETIKVFTDAVQARLDAFARTRNYDSILSACTYATSMNPKFAAEGQYCVEARDATWVKCYEVFHAVQSGQRPIPSWEELEAELPPLEWPT
jgi:hypothetical protein